MVMLSNLSYYIYSYFWLIWFVWQQNLMSHLIFVCSDSFGLFSYCTKWIYQFSLTILHCLSVHSNLVCFITVLNVIYVQIDNLMEVSYFDLNWPQIIWFLWLPLTSFFHHLGTSFFTGNHDFSSFQWQPSFFVLLLKCLLPLATSNFRLVTKTFHSFIQMVTFCFLSYSLYGLYLGQICVPSWLFVCFITIYIYSLSDSCHGLD